jgi:hypothetical protein
VRAAFERVASGAAADVTPLMVVIMAATVPVNVAITLYESRRGRVLGSQVLLADAAHTRTDILVTTSVVGGLIASALGLGWMDMVVALGVSVVIVRAAIRILREALVVLSDSIAIAASDVERVARSVPGVWFAHRAPAAARPARSRRPARQGGSGHVDRPGPRDRQRGRAQADGRAVRRGRRGRARRAGRGPAGPADAFERVLVRLRAIADGLGLGVHNVYVHEVPDGYGVALDVEVPGSPAGQPTRWPAISSSARWPRCRAWRPSSPTSSRGPRRSRPCLTTTAARRRRWRRSPGVSKTSATRFVARAPATRPR